MGRPRINTPELFKQKKTHYMLHKSWFCNICDNGKDYKLAGKTLHERSAKHKRICENTNEKRVVLLMMENDFLKLRRLNQSISSITRKIDETYHILTCCFDSYLYVPYLPNIYKLITEGSPHFNFENICYKCRENIVDKYHD